MTNFCTETKLIIPACQQVETETGEIRCQPIDPIIIPGYDCRPLAIPVILWTMGMWILVSRVWGQKNKS